MDATERLVEEHLRYRGYVDVVFEPDGNTPPDFLVNGRIAIEVRRLNQNHFVGDCAKGLEEVAISTQNRIRGLLASLGPPANGESWFVRFRLARPVESWQKLEQELRRGLTPFRDSPPTEGCIVAKCQGLELEVSCRTSTPHKSMFVLAGYSDKDSGGWLLPEMVRNIRYCTGEKARKIARVQSKYPEWWLALADRIGYGLDDYDREVLCGQVSAEGPWDRIVLIDPQDHRRWFEI